jgi:hypothetical protein
MSLEERNTFIREQVQKGRGNNENGQNLPRRAIEIQPIPRMQIPDYRRPDNRREQQRMPERGNR